MTMLRAAMAKVVITPEEPSHILGQFEDRYFAQPPGDVADDIHARILLLDDGESRLLTVSIDACMTQEEDALVGGLRVNELSFVWPKNLPPGSRKNWATAAGTGEDCVSVHATHSHSAPKFFAQKYADRIQQEIDRMVLRLVPVTVRAMTGTCDISVNRRPNASINLDLPIDKTLDVVQFLTEDGRSIGCLASFPVHATMMWTSQIESDRTKLSGDQVGVAMNNVEKRYGDGFVSMFLQGCGGDVGPLTGGPCGHAGEMYPLVLEAASKLSGSIIELLENDEASVPAFPLRYRRESLALPTKPQFEEGTRKVQVSITRLGDVVMVSVSGELFSGFIQKIKQRSPFPHTVCVTMCNDYTGYIPTKDAFHDGVGGYEVRTTPFTDEAEQRLLESIQSIMEGLK